MTDVADPNRRNDDDADLYTQTVKAPGVGNDEGTSLGDEDAPVTPQEEGARGNLEHGLGNPGGSTYDETVEDGAGFGLGADNTQDTPPVPEPDEPDPLRHGLETA